MLTDAYWYDRATAAIKERFGQEWRFGAKLLAACSANTTVERSVYLAERAYYQLTNHLELTRFLPNVRDNCLRALFGDPLRGRKVRAFYANLTGDLGPVTVDRWMLYAFDFDNKAPSKAQYDMIEREVTCLAVFHHTAPARVQSVIWARALRDARKRVPDLAELVQRRRLWN